MKAKTVVMTVTYDEQVSLAFDQRRARPGYYQDDLSDWMGLEPSVVANILTPAIVESGEPSAVHTL